MPTDAAVKAYIGCLESSLEYCDGMILCCDIIQALWSTKTISGDSSTRKAGFTHYFSTHGCSLVLSWSLGFGALEEEAPLVAAAAARALLLKKFDIWYSVHVPEMFSASPVSQWQQ